ncbi:hypothetical protein FRZ61_40040 [Hypericibacter adhaerens]|uniref:Uncharacterized protein n=1 Tax=Hypericibacter adhaerens TaxID=2602016 RepID=A0A5J6N5W2_9PROT|nr:hypothetical protein FRZ61_40040 [Hypericibacter adhaerens]
MGSLWSVSAVAAATGPAIAARIEASDKASDKASISRRRIIVLPRAVTGSAILREAAGLEQAKAGRETGS